MLTRCGSGALVSALGIEAVPERLPAEVALEVIEEDLDDPAVLVRDRARGVGAHEDVLKGPQLTLEREGLPLEHVECCAAEAALAERLDERDLVDERAPADVDENRGRPHGRQLVGSDQVPRL